MAEHGDVIIVIATSPNEAEATLIARTLVEARLAACVQLDPIRSFYRWQGNTEESPEVRLMIKTTSQRFDAVETLIKRHSSYQCPEILSYKVAQGAGEYLDWVIAETT
jgi:periplasmic divalent cation tolerance protein